MIVKTGITNDKLLISKLLHLSQLTARARVTLHIRLGGISKHADIHSFFGSLDDFDVQRYGQSELQPGNFIRVHTSVILKDVFHFSSL